MNYTFSYSNPSSQFLDIELRITNIDSAELSLQLPAWRPGRYELGNFAKNIRGWKALNKDGSILNFRKESKDHWKVETNGASEVLIKYSYYAAELNGGSTWLDEKQLYVNPVNCCLFIPEKIQEECTVELVVPENYEIACGLKKEGRNKLVARDFHELADSPFIASAGLAHNYFIYEGIEFHLWFQGMKNPDWAKLFSDFFVFVNEQYNLFKGFPVDEYHFLFQILPYPAYHGVEHLTSTVITLGPAYDVFEEPLYNELLGVSSHELFHTWNIKMIRPFELMPYNYSSENYTKLGWVAEGFTTYYGDLMLFRSRIFNEAEYFKTFNQQLKKHFDNPGRFNLSVADSSFDTWLDGYVAGVPARKTSIYTEGCLLAFMLDIIIRKNSSNMRSLDDVMRTLYNEYGKKEKGYSEKDVLQIINDVAGTPMEDFFSQYIFGTKDFKPLLDECLIYLGLEIKELPSPKFAETFSGIKISEEGHKAVVKSIYPGSPAESAGLILNDSIIAVNGKQINNSLDNWLQFYGKETKEVELSVFSSGNLRKLNLPLQQKEIYYKNYFLSPVKQISGEQKINYDRWNGRFQAE